MDKPNAKRKPKQVSRRKKPYKNKDGVIVYMTAQQKQFADALLEEGNSKTGKTKNLNKKTQEIYQTDENTARNIAFENVRKTNIIEYIGNRGYTAVDEIFKIGMNEENKPSDRLTALKDVADRAGHAPVKKSLQATVNIEQFIDDLI